MAARRRGQGSGAKSSTPTKGAGGGEPTVRAGPTGGGTEPPSDRVPWILAVMFAVAFIATLVAFLVTKVGESQQVTKAAAVPTATARAVAPTATAAPAATVQAAPTDAQTAHWGRLEKLDQTFRSQGWEAWLKTAGLSWDAITVEARQIEEETSPTSKIVASGVQVNGTNIVVNWPNIVTTDVPSRVKTTADTVQHQPDARNGSVLYTNVVVNGPVTVWISGYGWGQFTSRLGISDVAATSATKTPA